MCVCVHRQSSEPLTSQFRAGVLNGRYVVGVCRRFISLKLGSRCTDDAAPHVIESILLIICTRKKPSSKHGSWNKSETWCSRECGDMDGSTALGWLKTITDSTTIMRLIYERVGKKNRIESKPEARWLLTLCHAIAPCTKSNQIIERAKWKRHPCGSHVKISRAHGIQHEKIQCTTVGSEYKIIQIINSGSGNYLHCGGCGTADDAGNIVYAARSLFINNKSITGIYIIQKIQMKREIERHRASHTPVAIQMRDGK